MASIRNIKNLSTTKTVIDKELKWYKSNGAMVSMIHHFIVRKDRIIVRFVNKEIVNLHAGDYRSNPSMGIWMLCKTGAIYVHSSMSV